VKKRSETRPQPKTKASRVRKGKGRNSENLLDLNGKEDSTTAGGGGLDRWGRGNTIGYRWWVVTEGVENHRGRTGRARG